MTPIEEVLAALERHHCPPRRAGNGYQAKCPAHEDRNPSLSISEGADERVLLHCHAGCDTAAVLAALNLTINDTFTPKTDTGRATTVATYDYIDADQKLRYQVVRRSDKSFRQRRPDDQGGWIWNLQGIERILYRLPSVQVGVELGETIYVVEGEKDVHALEALNLVATCNPGGAGKWRAEYAAEIKGASEVVIVADNDEPGIKHAKDVQASLNGTPNRIVRAAKGKDAADHLANGFTIAQFVPLEPDEPPPAKATAKNDDPPTRTVELRNAATQYRRKTIQWLPKYEGFIPIGMLTILAGLQGYGKSLLTCLIAAQETNAGRRVAIASAEDSPEHVIIPRLEAVGANLNLCSIVALTIGDQDDELRLPAHTELLKLAILEARPSVLVIDPISAYLGSDIDSWKDSDVRSALRPLADMALEAMMACVVVAHLNKGGGSTDYLQRVAGNMAFTAAARSSLLFGADPTDPDGEQGSQRILALGKSNLAARNTKARQYRIESVRLSAIPEENIPEITAPKLEFLADVKISDRQILAGTQAVGSDAVKDAIAFLREYLADYPRERTFVEASAEARGITPKNLRSARERIGIVSQRQGFGAPALWSLPGWTAPEPEETGTNAPVVPTEQAQLL